jgi:hypothetical protein
MILPTMILLALVIFRLCRPADLSFHLDNEARHL